MKYFHNNITSSNRNHCSKFYQCYNNNVDSISLRNGNNVNHNNGDDKDYGSSNNVINIE